MRAPFYSFGVIPANAYEGLEGDTPTFTVGALWLVHDSVWDILSRPSPNRFGPMSAPG